MTKDPNGYHQAGIVYSATVDGAPSRVYLTIDAITEDEKPRWRYAPGEEKQHELIEKKTPVRIIEREFRFSMDLSSYRRS
jgi:hypothetical protein